MSSINSYNRSKNKNTKKRNTNLNIIKKTINSLPVSSVLSRKNNNNRKIENLLNSMKDLDPRLQSVLILFKHYYFISTIRIYSGNHDFFYGQNPVYDKLPKLEQILVKGMMQLFKSMPPLTNDLILYRGVPMDKVNHDTGITFVSLNDKNATKYATENTFKQKNNQNTNEKGCVLNIKINKGSKILPLYYYSDMVKEILLPPGNFIKEGERSIHNVKVNNKPVQCYKRTINYSDKGTYNDDKYNLTDEELNIIYVIYILNKLLIEKKLINEYDAEPPEKQVTKDNIGYIFMLIIHDLETVIKYLGLDDSYIDKILNIVEASYLNKFIVFTRLI